MWLSAARQPRTAELRSATRFDSPASVQRKLEKKKRKRKQLGPGGATPPTGRGRRRRRLEPKGPASPAAPATAGPPAGDTFYEGTYRGVAKGEATGAKASPWGK